MFNDILKEAIDGASDIIFTDYVDGAGLVRRYSAAKLFVYPSFFEGFGIPPLEAMACGTLVTVADATSLPEVVGDAGIYFDPFNADDIKDAMKKMLYDEKLREECVSKNLEQVKKFAWKKSSDIITECYRKVVR